MKRISKASKDAAKEILGFAMQKAWQIHFAWKNARKEAILPGYSWQGLCRCGAAACWPAAGIKDKGAEKRGRQGMWKVGRVKRCRGKTKWRKDEKEMGLFGKNKKYVEQEYLKECIQECMQECMRGDVQEHTQRYIRESIQDCVEEIVSGKGKELFHTAEGRLDTLEKNVGNVGKQVKRQTEAVEDLIDELQGKDTVIMDYEKRLKEKQRREEELLLLICSWQKQLSMMEERVCQEPMEDRERQEAWQKQFRLMKEQLAVQEKMCAVEEVGTEGEHVDYRIHEVIRALETEQEEKAGTVAKVHSRGLVYEGKVVVKAEVDAYKLPQAGGRTNAVN